MNAVTRSAVHVRLRRMFLEEVDDGSSTDFIDLADSPDEVDQAIDEGCQAQHATVLKNAEASGRLEEHDHDYLARFICREPIVVVRGTQDCAVPPDLFRRLFVTVGDLRAVYVEPSQDRLVRMYPTQYGPAKGEVFYTLLARGISSPADALDARRVIRLYVYGERYGVPLSAQDGEFVYYRGIRRMAYQSPPATSCDVEDPWLSGPLSWANSLLLEKAGQSTRTEFYRGVAEQEFAKVIAPPAPQAAR